MIESFNLLGYVLTINSIYIAPEINAVSVSVSVCDRCHVQLQAVNIENQHHGQI